MNNSDQPSSGARVAAPAPDFDLRVVDFHQRSSRVSLADYRGSWLALIFYPRDFSFVCPTELTAFSGKIASFQKRDCRILGISIDDLETHKRWLVTDPSDGGVAGLRFSLGTDPRGEMCRAYGVWRDDELPNRGLFLIDPKGVLRYSVIHDLGVGRNVDGVLQVLDALQSGGLCPANWVSADGTLDVARMLKPGRVLGHFRIEREVGSGAFGCVLEAYDMRLERSVALKVITANTDRSSDKLLGEARAAAAIRHPNVCSIFTVEEIDGLPTIVMEFVDGHPVREIIGDADREKSGLLKQIAEGVAAAHQRQIVHGDLKPANIILRSDGSPVIVDFGLANSSAGSRAVSPYAGNSARANDANSEETVDADPVDPNSTVDQDATLVAEPPTDRTGADHPATGRRVTGTPAYMSPEQARGEAIDMSSDIFSLGVLFVELVTGKHPYKTLRASEILTRLQQPSFVASIADQVPDDQRELFKEMLSPDRLDRPTASEVAHRLASIHP